MKIIVTYDVDDVLNNLNQVVHKELGIKLKDRKKYNIYKCGYSEEINSKMMELYNSPKIFERLKLVEGAKDIFNIEKEYDNVEVHIHSNNFNSEVALVKSRMLLKEIPGCTPEKLHMQIADTEGKSILEGTTIIVEDHIMNLRKYPKETMKILIDKPYNKSKNYDTTDREEGIIRVNSLAEANYLIALFIRTFNQLVEKC